MSASVLLAAILIAGGAVYLFVCVTAFAGLFLRERKISGATPFVSVIVPARNAAATIGALFDDLAAQSYPSDRFEILAVDDCSDDLTGAIIHERAAADPHIQPVSTSGSRSAYSHKKRAVHEGILASRGEIVMTVDADCRAPDGWIGGMIERFADGVDCVAGPVIVEGRGLAAGLEALEFAGIQAMAAGLLRMRFPITCNGASFAYRRSAFERVGGFDGVGSLVSGDDDLLMQKIARGDPSRVVFTMSPGLAVRAAAAHTAGEFLSKRTRWASKIGGYPSNAAVGLLSLFFLFFAAVILGAVLSLAGSFDWRPAALGFGMKAAGDVLLVAAGLAVSGRFRLLALFPLAELLHIPYIIGVTVRGFFGTFEWRGRRTKGRV